MAFVRTLFMLMGALSVLLLGAVPPAMADAPAPPCHEVTTTGHGDRTSQPGVPHQPDKPMKSMACCVACVTAPLLTPPDRSNVVASPATLRPAGRILPPGRGLTPETGPPKA